MCFRFVRTVVHRSQCSLVVIKGLSFPNGPSARAFSDASRSHENYSLGVPDQPVDSTPTKGLVGESVSGLRDRWCGVFFIFFWSPSVSRGYIVTDVHESGGQAYKGRNSSAAQDVPRFDSCVPYEPPFGAWSDVRSHGALRT